MLVERFYPDEYLDSTYSIDFAELAKKGYREYSLISTIHWFRTEHRQIRKQKPCLHI